MGAVAQPDFRRGADPDRRAWIMSAMRVARVASGYGDEEDIAAWAAVLGVIPAAVRAYEDGSNVPCVDTFMEAMERAGRPAGKLLRQWTERTARRTRGGVVPLRRMSG